MISRTLWNRVQRSKRSMPAALFELAVLCAETPGDRCDVSDGERLVASDRFASGLIATFRAWGEVSARFATGVVESGGNLAANWMSFSGVRGWEALAATSTPAHMRRISSVSPGGAAGT